MNAISKMHQPQIDPRELRDALGCFATGVCVVTTVGDKGAPVGMTINSFSSVSLDPPLILWSIGLNAPSRSAFHDHGCFAVNIMGVETKDLTLQFARPSDNKFQGVKWAAGHNGVPVLAEAMTTLECEMEDRIISGDHEIFIGRVLKIGHGEGEPLLFHRGRFSTIGTEL